MAMGFQNNSRLRQLFELPPPYGTPGIGEGMSGAAPSNGVAALPPMEAANRSPARMAFRGVGGMDAQPQRAPISTLPLDTPLEPSGFQLEPLAPTQSLPPKKAGFFERDGAWRDVLGALADGMAGAAGQQPIYGPMKMRERQQQAEWERQNAVRQQDRDWAREDQAWKLNQPQYFMSGRDRVMFDPTTGEAQTVYDGPTDFEEYATLMGLEPGSDDYNEAMQDFVLRSNGPTAQAGRQDLENIRQGNRVSLEGVRQGNRAALRQMPTYANLHARPAASGGSGGGGGNRPPRTTGNVYAPILAKLARGEKLMPGEQQVISLYGRGGRAGGKPGPGTGGLAGVQTVHSPAEARKLPKGTRYRTPDGRMMVR